jgi:hypothetical protein
LTVRVRYLSEADSPIPGVEWRRGQAGFVLHGAGGELVVEERMVLSANTTHALLGHGVVDELNRLPIQGRLGTGLQVLVPPAQLEPVRDVLYRADSKTYGAEYEFALELREPASAGNVEYRIRIDNREYQNALSGLQFLFRTAAHEGMAAWLLL